MRPALPRGHIRAGSSAGLAGLPGPPPPRAATGRCVPRCVPRTDPPFPSQPIQIISSTMEMVKPGKFPSGKTEIPFEFPLQGKGGKVLYETYHGVFVSIQVSGRPVVAMATQLQLTFPETQ